ncbi:MAG: nucleoside triphosphate pyrophosphohydrolase [Spirochaetaceae bacterium]|jgi:predicted house-cleaning noncanonical NTP pyrophosphatase (MazG superfamily)|nr:nucleoside triphosphate pyrophosphohydrolase [Spirochaetaceae bacterium]
MSRIIVYDKLIRDKIPQIIESHGKTCEVSVLSDQEFKKYLYKKLQEEVNEFLADDSIEELADITEVIHGILKLKNTSPEDLEDIKLKKLKERGGFDKKFLLRKVVD